MKVRNSAGKVIETEIANLTFKPFNLDNIGRMGRNVFFLMQGFSKKLLVYSRKIWPNKNNIYKLIRGTRRRREKSDNNFSVTG